MKELSPELVKELRLKANQIRRDICITTSKLPYAHLGGGMSMTDMVTALYYDVLNFDPKDPRNPDRDRFVLSKGHCAHVLYNVLVDLGLYTKEELWSEYNQIHGRFGMHPNYLYLPGIDASTGSLGQGMALAVGMALAGRIDKKDYRVFCMTGDGELQEGSNWEAIMAASDSQIRRKPIAIISNTRKAETIPDLENTPNCHLRPMPPQLLEKCLARLDEIEQEIERS